MSYHWLNTNIKTHGRLVEENSYQTLQNSKNSKNSSSLHWLDSDCSQLETALMDEIDLICLSHLRWDFVYQRPQHLLNRCVQERRVFFVEEPILTESSESWTTISQRESGVWVIVPHIPQGADEADRDRLLRSLMNDWMADCQIQNYLLWYYTPMALSFTDHLQPTLVVYDCMDELSAFKDAPPILKQREAELFQRAALVFTGGQSLYESKRHQHPQVYAFPSSIEVPHFAQARQSLPDPEDQAHIPHPRLGFFGVIDERMDVELLAKLAELRPDWHLVILGPVVKIDPATLPQRENIHYLGGKPYQQLPHYIAGWDVALLPFALNESTRFISPTKTPEYLAAGKPVVSTPIRDVVRPYEEKTLVQIADTAEAFVGAVETAIQQAQPGSDWLQRVDRFLSQNSWDHTWLRMSDLITRELTQTAAKRTFPHVNSRSSRSIPTAS